MEFHDRRAEGKRKTPTNFDEIGQKLGFSEMTQEQRGSNPPISPFSITRETRQGVKGFRTTDMRTMRSMRTGTKREATGVAKVIEHHHYYGGESDG
jgi:hypothetical protein